MVGVSPPPSFPTSPPFPDGFPLAATRAVTHAVKILPSPANYKQKMRLDSRALPGDRGLRDPHPREGAGNSARAVVGRSWGLTEHPRTERGTPAPIPHLNLHPRPRGVWGSESHRGVGAGEGRGPGMILGGFFPWSHAWAGKTSHTQTWEPPQAQA